MKLGWVVFSLLAFGQQQDPMDLNPHLSYTPNTSGAAKSNGFFETRERTYTVNGIEYREIQYNGDVFVVRGRQTDTAPDCTQSSPPPPDTFAADAKMQIAQRTSFYIESLRMHCDPVQHRMVTKPDIRDSNVGVKFQGAQPGDSDKKIFINPLNRTGGAGITF